MLVILLLYIFILVCYLIEVQNISQIRVQIFIKYTSGQSAVGVVICIFHVGLQLKILDTFCIYSSNLRNAVIHSKCNILSAVLLCCLMGNVEVSL